MSSVTPTSSKIASLLWVIVSILVLTVLIYFSSSFKKLLDPAVIVTATVDKSCDLRKGECISILPNGEKVSLSINPADIPLMTPLLLQVKTESIDALDVEVDIVGIGMDMGFNRTKLKSNDNINFNGSLIIPICSRSRMDWEARILLKTEKGIIMVPFLFFTDK